MFKTADLCDEYPQEVQVAQPLFRDYGGALAFGGPIATVKVDDDNAPVRQLLETPGAGRVLVVDNGGSLRCALVGDRLAQLAITNGWAGIVVYGCIRDSAELAAMPIGIKALATLPRKSYNRAPSQQNIPLRFAGLDITPGHYLYADTDGIIVAARPLVIT